MAKRRRLIPAPLAQDLPEGRAPEVKAMFPMGVAPPPISRVAAEQAAIAAAQELAAEVQRATDEGRLIRAVPLAAVDAGHLVRDRIGVDEEELQSLMESLRAHGQRSAIEVERTGAESYGLISGWRRLTALRRLHEETGEARFATVLTLLRRPEAAADAYVAMVEENEIRLGLSYYERARIAARAVEAGVFPTEKIALQRLYSSASRAKRSKIRSFLTVHAGLGSALRHPAAIPERLGLMLAKRIEEDADFAPRARAALTAAADAGPEAELALLQRLMKPAAKPVPVAEEIAPGVRLTVSGRGDKAEYRLSGPGLPEDFAVRLRAWLDSL